MFKYLLAVIITFSSSITQASPYENGCDISYKEKLVCSMVLCNPLGMLASESRSECIKINAEYALYVSTLGFFDPLPSCFARDENCNKIGKASSAQMSPVYCVGAGDIEKQKACMAALRETPEEYCNQFDTTERKACRSVQQTGWINSYYCYELADELAKKKAEENFSGKVGVIDVSDQIEIDEIFRKCRELYKIKE